MKKIILILLTVIFCSITYGQKITNLPVVTANTTGTLLIVRQGASGNQLSQMTKANFFGMFDIDSLIYVSATKTLIGLHGTDTVNFYIPYADRIDWSTIYVKLAPDTVQHTDSYTIAASDWGKDQHILKGTSVAITFPLNLNEWPVGGVMDFYGMGAGIMVFKKAAGVYFITEKDSIASSRKGQKVRWKKINANTYMGVDNLTD